MPRIARPASQALLDGQAAVRRYLSERNVKQSELAAMAGVASYTVSRLLSGRIKDVTPDVDRLVKVAKNGLRTKVHGAPHPRSRLTEWVDDLWDGTDQGAERLLRVLEAAKPLLKLLTTR